MESLRKKGKLQFLNGERTLLFTVEGLRKKGELSVLGGERSLSSVRAGALSFGDGG